MTKAGSLTCQERVAKWVLGVVSVFLFAWLLVVLEKFISSPHQGKNLVRAAKLDRWIAAASLVATVAIPWVLYILSLRDKVETDKLNASMRSLAGDQVVATQKTAELTGEVRNLANQLQALASRGRRDDLIAKIDTEFSDQARIRSYAQEALGFEDEVDRGLLLRSLRANPLVPLPMATQEVTMLGERPNKRTLLNYCEVLPRRYQRSPAKRMAGLSEVLRSYEFHPDDSADFPVLTRVARTVIAPSVVGRQKPSVRAYRDIFLACPPLTGEVAEIITTSSRGGDPAAKATAYVGLAAAMLGWKYSGDSESNVVGLIDDEAQVEPRGYMSKWLTPATVRLYRRDDIPSDLPVGSVGRGELMWTTLLMAERLAQHDSWTAGEFLRNSGKYLPEWLPYGRIDSLVFRQASKPTPERVERLRKFLLKHLDEPDIHELLTDWKERPARIRPKPRA